MPSHSENKAAPPSYVLSTHYHCSNTPTVLAVSPDTTWIASGLEDGTILLVHSPNSHIARYYSADLLTAWCIHRNQPTDEEPEPAVVLEPLAPAHHGPAYILSPPIPGPAHILALA
ncbi:uncharacterized protein TRAVEDRAFT_49908 [Trametes versicolor FP-101664 SS1]|uniref:uncharacterized protein n=1 Tax=Trametes versicolor (strain FP-101664) TaxID=717944 RepID=UPI000462193B|nr:uncharacterized protein TRAVEDRAFT_49908 [Trametes versicolor FP-101664 SS1]EIW57094.1 hypothetical protein TRAVEDRAFT_49908 [Trametes versicolor FP-101664 SS1]